MLGLTVSQPMNFSIDQLLEPLPFIEAPNEADLFQNTMSITGSQRGQTPESYCDAKFTHEPAKMMNRYNMTGSAGDQYTSWLQWGGSFSFLGQERGTVASPRIPWITPAQSNPCHQLGADTRGSISP
jgi:hypothetical protein